MSDERKAKRRRHRRLTDTETGAPGEVGSVTDRSAIDDLTDADAKIARAEAKAAEKLRFVARSRHNPLEAAVGAIMSRSAPLEPPMHTKPPDKTPAPSPGAQQFMADHHQRADDLPERPELEAKIAAKTRALTEATKPQRRDAVGKKKGKPPKKRRSQTTDLKNATTATDVVTALARFHGGNEVDLRDFAAWLPQCPEPDRIAAINRLTTLTRCAPHPEQEIAAGVWEKTLTAAHSIKIRRFTRNIKEVHDLWCRHPTAEHPLAPIILGYLRRHPAKLNTKRHINLPAPLVATRHVVVAGHEKQSHLPFDYEALQAMQPPPPDKPRFVQQAWLPDFAPAQSRVIPWALLNLWDSGPSRGTGGPVPIPQRVGWELLLAPAPAQYINGTARVSIDLGNLASLVWPQTGRYKRTVHGPQLREAARWLNDPDNAMEWSAHALDLPENLVLWHRAPVAPFHADQKISAYVTAPGGVAQRGAQIDNHLRRLLAATSYRQHRVYVGACILWDRHATFNGFLVQLTVPEVSRHPAGYILDAEGEIITEKDGSPSRRATHPLAVHTGKRLPNPAADKAFLWLEGDDPILIAHHRVLDTLRERNIQRRHTIKTLNELRSRPAGAVLDFEARYRSEGHLSGATIHELTELKKLPPPADLEAVRLLPPMAHYAAHQARREERETTKKAHHRGHQRKQ